jgi:hypothetical protein
MGLTIGGYNMLLNTVNTLVLVGTLSNHPIEYHNPGWKQWLGLGLFVVG